jgi:hypothetical protein
MMLEEAEHEMLLGSATVQFSHLLHSGEVNETRSREEKSRHEFNLMPPFMSSRSCTSARRDCLPRGAM